MKTSFWHYKKKSKLVPLKFSQRERSFFAEVRRPKRLINSLALSACNWLIMSIHLVIMQRHLLMSYSPFNVPLLNKQRTHVGYIYNFTFSDTRRTNCTWSLMDYVYLRNNWPFFVFTLIVPPGGKQLCHLWVGYSLMNHLITKITLKETSGCSKNS